MSKARSILALTVASFIAFHAHEAWAQGALKPVEAVIVNPDSRPVPVKDRTGLLRYQHYATITLDHCSSGLCQFTFPAVPTGKRLVVTHASGQLSLPTDQIPHFDLAISSSAPEESLVFMVPQSVGPPVGPVNALRQYYVASGPVTLHVAAGEAPVLRTGGFGFQSATVSIVGHLIDIP